MVSNPSLSLRVDGDTCYLAGVIDFSTAPTLLTDVAEQFEANRAVTVDFSSVEHANSAALAVLLQWKEQAAEKGCTVNHQNLPDSIRQLSEICQVSALI